MTQGPASWMERLPVTVRYAVRNLTRNHRRTLLSTLGVAVGCSIALINIGMVRGKVDMFIRNVAEGGVGHVKVVPKGWMISRDPRLRLVDWQETLDVLRKDPRVKVATPCTRIQGMLAMGTRLCGVALTGVDPDTEPQATRFVRTMETGRYLRAGDRHTMVIGKAIAEKLGVGEGDDVVVTVVDRTDSMKSELFNVVGIVDLGSSQMESQVCQVVREDVEDLSALPGVGEITVLLKDSGKADEVRDSTKSWLPPGDEAYTWDQVNPQSRIAVRINYVVSEMMTWILVLVALLGVASAQLTAVLERRKELAVLSALGMGRGSIFRLVLSEALALGTVSALVTMALAGPVSYYYSKVGITVLGHGKSMAALGTMVDPVLYGDFGAWFFLYAAVLSYLATVAASLYPAWFAMRLDPAETLRMN